MKSLLQLIFSLCLLRGFNSEFAMKRAIENVDKNYAVVGILEEMNMTLTVLEHYIPRFFKGAKELYNQQARKYTRVNKNIYKPKVEERVKDIVRKNFTREIEFYEFCRQRLYKQYAALNLPDSWYIFYTLVIFTFFRF